MSEVSHLGRIPPSIPWLGCCEFAEKISLHRLSHQFRCRRRSLIKTSLGQVGGGTGGRLSRLVRGWVGRWVLKWLPQQILHPGNAVLAQEQQSVF